MFQWFVIAVFVLGVAVPASSQNGEEPYDEWAESPTVEIEGCGVYPSVRVLVDGQDIDARGFIRRGRTYLPAREALERMGATVTWARTERAFYAQYPENDRTIRVALGNSIVRIFEYDADARYGKGREMSALRMNAAPMACGGRVYVPVRSAAEAAGAIVSYGAEDRTVRITSPRSNNR